MSFHVASDKNKLSKEAEMSLIRLKGENKEMTDRCAAGEVFQLPLVAVALLLGA